MAHHPIDIGKVISPEVESRTARSPAGSIGEDQLGPTTNSEQVVRNGTQAAEDGPFMDPREIQISCPAGSTGEEAGPVGANRHRGGSPVMDNRDARTEIVEATSPTVESRTARSATGSTGEEAGPVGANPLSQNDQRHRESSPFMAHHSIDIEGITEHLASFTRGLEERENESGRTVQAPTLSRTIFKIPKDLREINSEAAEPKLFSIGPYHRGHPDLREFEDKKPSFLKSFLRRWDSDENSLFQSVAYEADSAFGCYSDPKMEFEKFTEMMLLDGCFVVELLLQISREEDAKAPILGRQGIIPVLIRDLLKLENQVPYSLLELFFQWSFAPSEIERPHLWTLALRVFNMVYPELNSKELTDPQYIHYRDIDDRKHNHLLDLFSFALFLGNSVPQNDGPSYRPSEKSIPCVTQLRPCGIKFKSKNTERFLDISFRKGVLEIPSIAINDFMITVLINCIALEQCPDREEFQKCQKCQDYIALKKCQKCQGSITLARKMCQKCHESIALEQRQESNTIAPEQHQESCSEHEHKHKHITDYVSFMHCLIKHPEDSSLLCSDGIMSTLSHDDKFVVELFDGLGKGIVFNVNNCYLSKQFKELELYYRGCWGSMIRTYFSSPWAAIAAFSAFLTIALAVTQTVYAVFGHHFR